MGRRYCDTDYHLRTLFNISHRYCFALPLLPSHLELYYPNLRKAPRRLQWFRDNAALTPRQLRSSAPQVSTDAWADVVVAFINGNLSVGKTIIFGVYNIAVCPIIRGNAFVFRYIASIVFYGCGASIMPKYGRPFRQFPDSAFSFL